MTVRVTSSSAGDSRSRFLWMKAAVTWADEIGPLVRTAMRTEAPAGKGPNSGRLRRSLRYERRTTGSTVTLKFGSGVPYAPYVVSGTRRHFIRPVAARALRWVGPDGKPVFSRLVDHPGTRANDFPRRAIALTEPVIRERFYAIMRRAGGGA